VITFRCGNSRARDGVTHLPLGLTGGVDSDSAVGGEVAAERGGGVAGPTVEVRVWRWGFLTTRRRRGLV
jgi:hypothetical protein